MGSLHSGHIKYFREIFDSLPKSVLYKDLGMNNQRFTQLMNNVELFTLNDLFRIADLIETDKKNILDIAYAQYQIDSTKKTSSKKLSAVKRSSKR